MFESVQYCEAQRNEAGGGIKRAGEKLESSVGRSGKALFRRQGFSGIGER